MNRRGSSAAGAVPTSFRVVFALTLPLVAAMTVVGTYLRQEVVLFAAILSLSITGFLFARPLVGIAVMTGGFMLAAYPTALQALGVLSVINMVGLCLLVLLLAQILVERDLSTLFPPPVMVLLGIGLLFLISTLYADIQFPTLQVSRADGRTGYRIIDKTSRMTEDFITRLAYLVFIISFVRKRADVRMLYAVFMVALFVAVPSALWNWVTGEMIRDRVVASVTAGSNSNRLGMICCIELVCWWFWYRASPTAFRATLGMSAIVASILVMAGTGSRSTLVGGIVAFVMMQLGPTRFSLSPRRAVGGALAFTLVLLFVAPPAAVDRMFNFFPSAEDSAGASSIELREGTLDTGRRIIADHPFLGVGLGNFREVARQIYADKFFRPPHNSYLWAAAEGGIIVVLGYGILFWLTWQNFTIAMRLADRDPEVGAIAAGLRGTLGVFMLFAAFADLFLSPLLYLLVGLSCVCRRTVETTPAQVAVPDVRLRHARAA